MKIEDATKMVEIDPELSIRTDYSGRGMFGRTTVAIVGGHKQIMDAAQDAGIPLDYLRFDSMGKYDVVAY
jgi:hypothetical protein